MLRKPVPLGTEIKNVADGVTGMMLKIEIVASKEEMRRKEIDNLGSGTSIIKVLLKKKHIFINFI